MLEEPLKVGCCFDEFDGDLYRLVPYLRDSSVMGEAKGIHVFTYGSADKERRIMSHPCTWNGWGALFFSCHPAYPRDEHGWASINGCVTKDPLLWVTVETAIRDAFVHMFGDSWRLDGAPWIECHDMQMALLGDARGWQKLADDERQEVRGKVARWAEDSARYALAKMCAT